MDTPSAIIWPPATCRGWASSPSVAAFVALPPGNHYQMGNS